MGQPEKIDHVPAGLPLGQSLRERGPGGGILGAGKEAVAADRPGKRLRFAAQGMDHMAIIDAMHALSVAPKARLWRDALAQARMADDMGSPEPSFDPVVVDVDVSPEANLRFDAADRSAVRVRCRRHHGRGNHPFW